MLLRAAITTPHSSSSPGFASCASMEASGKRTRGEGSSARDQLSDLPDAVLNSILSFLKARQVVQTSVLSRRWRSLWRSVPCLDVDQKEFQSSPALFSQRELEKFEDFGDFLLTRHEGSVLDAFRLHISEIDSSNIDVGRWIRRALTCSLRALHIHSDSICVVKMPQNWGYSSRSLTRLHFRGISLDETFEEVINTVCVVLEDLELKECMIYFDKITSTSLRNLIMDGGYIDNNQLIITASHLASLQLILSDTSFQISVNELLSLIQASIRFDVIYLGVIDRKAQHKLLSNLFNATSLELSGFLKMILSDVEFPTFKNLRTLLLDKCDFSDNFQLLHHFVHNSPNLEKLTVRCCKLPNGSAGGERRAKLKKLKSIEIIYKDGDDILELISVLLKILDRELKNTIILTKV
ncbi:hypothetical protein ACP70R_011640 [Stipagrostis hirtigluma subsp. patula]